MAKKTKESRSQIVQKLRREYLGAANDCKRHIAFDKSATERFNSWSRQHDAATDERKKQTYRAEMNKAQADYMRERKAIAADINKMRAIRKKLTAVEARGLPPIPKGA